MSLVDHGCSVHNTYTLEKTILWMSFNQRLLFLPTKLFLPVYIIFYYLHNPKTLNETWIEPMTLLCFTSSIHGGPFDRFQRIYREERRPVMNAFRATAISTRECELKWSFTEVGHGKHYLQVVYGFNLCWYQQHSQFDAEYGLKGESWVLQSTHLMVS